MWYIENIELFILYNRWMNFIIVLKEFVFKKLYKKELYVEKYLYVD